MTIRKPQRLSLLLDKGFYPAELPPVFRTKNFSKVVNNLNITSPNNYSGSTTYYDGATFRGHLRTFGVINPVNYYLLSDFLAGQWQNIQKVFALCKSSGARPTFTKDDLRAIKSSTLTQKRKRLAHLAASYPVVLNLDINRFYGSIYTHSIPWAVLGKDQAKAMYSSQNLNGHWSDTLDKRTRNCNQRQTVGIAIGPDTSRIISELLLSRIDAELCAKGTKISSSQLFHSIDDYQIGVMQNSDAEQAQSIFQRVVHRYEMRINDFKTKVSSGIGFSPAMFQRHFDILEKKSGQSFIEHLFELIYTLKPSYPDINIVGYALKRFKLKLASPETHDITKEYLQRLTFASPHDARWTLPLWLGIVQETGSDADTKRFIQWGIETSTRRNDVLSLLWFLYAAIFLQLKIDKQVCQKCFEISNELVDLMLFHGKALRLFSSPSISLLRDRYTPADYKSPSWLVLYEVDRHDWDRSTAFLKMGTGSDVGNAYRTMKNLGVEFYAGAADRSAFNLEALSGWNLSSDDFKHPFEDDDFAELFNEPNPWEEEYL